MIITQFLQAIRPSAPDRKPDQLNAIVLETLDLLGPEIINRGIELIKDLDEQLPDPPLDRSQIKQVLVNLIKNAMQAMDKDGLLTVRTQRDADGVWLLWKTMDQASPRSASVGFLNPTLPLSAKARAWV